ncbi:transglutaminase domain-containing protein [Amycolatopsis orientalis]|uniref:transglutaminase domain-containing protein n=1 Tax=Amycolatopsis orientalis TaxID=31958 RepID=UPI00056628A4|nr:transglutaminase domain-containing protein [Amycolatopsis orientalis]
MTCVLVTPWWRRRVAGDGSAAGGVAPTAILDWRDPSVRSLARATSSEDRLAGLRAAHLVIAGAVRPGYAVRERQPISRTLRRGRGSCSQRLAILEGVARAQGVPTRVRGLLVDGRFWYPRFPRAKFLVPSRVLVAWPEFRVDDAWVPVGELFGLLPELAAGPGFSNDGGETLFDAVSRTAIDWDGVTCGTGGACDLSATVLADLGRFDSRDELFRRHGQTLSGPVTRLVDPVLSRCAPS